MADKNIDELLKQLLALGAVSKRSRPVHRARSSGSAKRLRQKAAQRASLL
jgi:hypothetical protein